MAKLTLNVESNAFEAFNKATEGMENLRSGVNEFETDGKKAFTTVNKEAQTLTNKLKETAAETVNSSNKIIDGKNKEKVAISLLKQQIADVIEHEKRLKDVIEKSAPGKEWAKYQKQLSETRFDLKGMQDDLKKMEEAEKSLTPPVVSLKKQLKDLKEQIATATDPEAAHRLTLEAGELEDKIADTNAAVKAFAADTKATTAKTLFSQISDDVLNLDFKAAADKSKQLLAVANSITFKEGVEGVKALGTTLANVGKALLTNPIFLLGAAVLLIIVNFDKLKSMFSETEKELARLTDAYDEQKRVTEALVAAGERELALAEAQGKSDEELLVIKKKILYARIEEAKSLIALNTAKTLAAKSNDTLNESYFRLTAQVNKFLGLNKAAAVSEVLLAKEKQKNNQEALDAQAKAEQDLLDLLNQIKVDEINTDKKINEERKKAYEEYLKLRKDLEAALADLAKRSQQAELEGLFGRERLDRQKEINDQELKLLRETIEKKGKLVDKNFKFSAEQEEQFAALKTKINQEYYDGILKLEADNATKIADSRKKQIDSEIAFLELKQKLAEEQVKSVTAPKGSSKDEEALFELRKQSLLLELKKSFIKQSLDLKLKQADDEAIVQATALQNEKDALENFHDQASEERKVAIDNQLKQINEAAVLQKEIIIEEAKVATNECNKELEKIGEGLKPKKIDLEKLLGGDVNEISLTLKAKVGIEVSPEDVQSTKDALGTLADSLKSILNDYFEAAQKQLDEELRMNEERIQAREDAINDLKDRLDEEKELRDQGLANDVDRIKAEIAAQEAARQADLNNERKLKKEKLKLAKEQLIIDTITQASQMVLAIAQLYAALSSFRIGPIPVGVIIATATSAAMIGAFAAGKKKAFDAVNSGNKGLRKGGYTGDGHPDEVSGHFTHKQEFVQTAEDTKLYRPLFEGIHKKNNKLISIGIKDLLKNTGVFLDDEIPKSLSDKKEAAREADIKMSFNNDNSGVERRVDGVEHQLKRIYNQLDEKTIIKPDGAMIIKKGNITRTIRRKP